MMPSVAAINNLADFAHNPRGNLWFHDESTYGHKLLSKMGWSKGKGLGKNEDGIKENLKVKFKGTNSGLGFKDDAYTNVMKTEYESILKNLNAEYSSQEITNGTKESKNFDQEPNQKSSKIVKSKLRYPKLFFGKDVTKYSEKDMKSIFICSVPLKSVEEKSKDTVAADEEEHKNELPKPCETYNSNLSISDYFAKKMEEKRNASVKDSSSNSINQLVLNSDVPNLSSNKSVSSKRKKKDLPISVDKESIDVKVVHQDSSEINDLETENTTFSNKKSSKKRKRKAEIHIDNNEINSLDANEIECCISDSAKEVLENPFKSNVSEGIDANEKSSYDSHLRPSKKRKVSESFKNGETLESLDTLKKKKKKKKKHHSVELLSENSLCNSGDKSTENSEEINNYLEHTENKIPTSIDSSKKKKKSKRKLKDKLKSCLKSKSGSYSLKNVSFNETVSYRIIDTEIESVDPLICHESLDQDTESDEPTDNHQNDSGSNIDSDEKITYDENNSNDNSNSKTNDKDISDESDSGEKSILSELPSSKSSHYNSWVESQRQALKMRLYKQMLKDIKTHEILKTTNLSSIKGYGNWGFK